MSFLFLGWCENYNDNIVDEKELQLEIDTYMSNYDKTSAARVQTEKETVDNEDEDGWKTVTKKYFFCDLSKNYYCNFGNKICTNAKFKYNIFVTNYLHYS